jgi:hypothetical protein
MRVRKLLAVLAVTTLTAGVGVVAMGGAPTGAAETSGYTVIWDEGGCQLATIDLTTAAVTPIGAASQTSCVSDLAVAPDGTVYGTLNSKNGGLDAELVKFDTATGAATTLGPITGSFTSAAWVEGGIAFGADDSMYLNLATDEAGCSDFVCLYRADPTTLVASLIGPSNEFRTDINYFTASCAGALESTFEPQIDPPASLGDGDNVNATEFNQSLGSWNGTTGAITEGAPLIDTLDVAGIEFDRVSGTLYLIGFEDQPAPAPVIGDEAPVEPQITNLASLYTVDVATGTLTLVADVPDAELFVDSLGIPGRCTAPAIELQPTFTG